MLRNADVFVKPRHDLRTKSASGGVVTLIAGSTAFLLFLAQIYLYIVGNTNHTLHLSESRPIPMSATETTDPFQSRMYDIKGKMALKLHITFPHISCKSLEVKLNNAELAVKDFDAKGRGKVTKRRPNPVELKAAGFDASHPDGCNIKTVLRVPIVAGQVSIALTKTAWSQALNHLMIRAQYGEDERKTDDHLNDYNMTHYIHTIQFGKRFPYAADYPLEGRSHKIENSMGGVALENIQVKLVPTVYSGFFSSYNSYQLSVVNHVVQPETMVAQGVALSPGLALGYDVTPLAVHHLDGRDNVLVFLSSLISIVGGVFVTVGLFTGCLVESAKTVAKKVD